MRTTTRYIVILIQLPDPNVSSAIYRVIELAGGWNGRVFSTQVYFSTFALHFLFIWMGMLAFGLGIFLIYVYFLMRPTDIRLYFTDVLDGAMVILAIYTFNLAHPGLLLLSRRRRSRDDATLNDTGHMRMRERQPQA